MKNEKEAFCNLCQKSLNHEEFMKHLPNDHLPETVLRCAVCEQETCSIQQLENHYNNQHRTDETDTYRILSFHNMFDDINDILMHTKGATEWIQKSFSNSVSHTSKREMQKLIKSTYNINNDDNENINGKIICNLCNDNDIRPFNLCKYCGQTFSRCSLKKHVLQKHLLVPSTVRKAINMCDVCGTIFSNNKLLSQHKNLLHRNHLTKNKAYKEEKKSPFCHFCGKALANKSNLRRHVLNQHSEEIGAPPNNNVFTCDYCKCFFSNKSSVKRHIENLHLKMNDTRKSISCFQCEQRFNSIKNLNAHLTIEHNVIINEEKLQFSNLGEFWEWKQDEETRTNSRFIQLRGLRRQRRKGIEISTLKFVCNRSGIFHSKSNGKRAYRIKGSSKIGRYCSAYIEIMFKENASVNGTYCSTHSGHDNDLRYLTLTMDEKREIYEKIKSGATFSAILNEIRNSVGKEIKRKHLVTNKDLHNIVTTFRKLSKPAQSDQNIEQSLENTANSIEHLTERNDRNFNNDLDICADLWVETCQRMMNRFDQNELRNDLSKDFSKIATSKNLFEDDLQQSNTRDKISRINNSTYVNNDYTPNGITDNAFKPNYTTYEGEINESRINSDLSFLNGVSRASEMETKNFCEMATISDDLPVNKNYYPVDNISDDGAIDNMVKLSSACSSSYSSLSSGIENSDSSAYLQNTDIFDKVHNSIGNSFNSYNFINKLPPISPNQRTTYLSSPIDDVHLDDSILPDTTTISSGNQETPSENIENNDMKQNDECDLRDRVNSVTALYNIVESELDERKKNIIRNYVDNMFRVLQYRYNKSKTKKKQNTEKIVNSEKISKKRIPLSKTKKNQKIKTPVEIKSTQFSSSASEYLSHNSLNNVPNVRSDTNFMRWDQY